MESTLLDQIELLSREIQEDRIAIQTVPKRFQEAIETTIIEKETELERLNGELSQYQETQQSFRLTQIHRDFQQLLVAFFETYPFHSTDDKVRFLSSLSFEIENDGLVSSLTNEEENSLKRKWNKIKMRVSFPDGSIIEEHKTTDAFTKVIKAIGITKIQRLKITVLKLPLIGNEKSPKYQQRELKPNVYLVTQLSNDKKVEILEYISDKLDLNLKVNLIYNINE